MPADSTTIEEEGILIDNFLLVDEGRFRESALQDRLRAGYYPARNPVQNLLDLKAQVAACERGVQELHRMIDQFGLNVVQAYMNHVQDNAADSVRHVIDRLEDGSFTYAMDDGASIVVSVTVDKVRREVTVDFTGSAPQHSGNANAPKAVTLSAVLYVFRCLVQDNIPLNGACLRHVRLIIPEGSVLNPVYPAAVVAGNVETSQCIVDALLGALGVMAGSQGTMNNLTFGNARHQYYETLCGGAGAGPSWHGTAAVHTHMTNTRLTDPEILEWRYPVRLESFSIRTGSGGLGRYHGGDGVVRRIRFQEPMAVSLLTNHRQVPPFGMAGGESGECGWNVVERADGSRQHLGSCDTVQVRAGDILEIATPGGGGYGAPEPLLA
jgi:5-oxoprolinase (ATP-hydrolysing)